MSRKNEGLGRLQLFGGKFNPHISSDEKYQRNNHQNIQKYRSEGTRHDFDRAFEGYLHGRGRHEKISIMLKNWVVKSSRINAQHEVWAREQVKEYARKREANV